MNSFFQNIEYQIIKNLNLAQSRILIAVAWFTNNSISNEILKKKDLDIEILVDDNNTNKNSINIKNLLKSGIDITFIKDINKQYYLMHNKFCIIDNRIVITGSYNWTKNANSNDENISIFDDEVNARYYTQEFRRIKNLEYSNNNIFISIEESNQIINAIYSHFIELLKNNITNLKPNLVSNWDNEFVKNLIRKTNENIRNNLKDRIESFQINMELVSKYGIENFSVAPEEERIELKDKFSKEGLDEIEHYINLELQYFKLKAIQNLQNNYISLLKNNINDQTTSERIIKVLQFLTKEKINITTKIGK